MKRAHQALHRQRDFLRRGEPPFPTHRPAHVQKQHCRGARIVLRFVNRKVRGANPHRHAAAVQQRVLERLNHVDVHGVALHVGAAGFENQLLAAAIARRVTPQAVAAQLPVNIPQRQMADAPHALGRQFEALALLEHVAALFE